MKNFILACLMCLGLTSVALAETPQIYPGKLPPPTGMTYTMPMTPQLQSWCTRYMYCLSLAQNDFNWNQETLNQFLQQYPAPVRSDTLTPPPNLFNPFDIMRVIIAEEYTVLAAQYLANGGNLTAGAARLLWNLTAHRLLSGSSRAACEAIEAAIPKNNELWQQWLAIRVVLPNLCQ